MARKKEDNERRKMETELRNLARFPSENPNAVLRFDKDGVLLYSNPASENMLGKMLEESDRKLPEHWHKHVNTALSSGNRQRFEEQINGFIYSFLVAPLVSEGYVNIYGEDITDRKRMEQELRATLEASQRRQDEVSALLGASKAVLQHQEFRNSAGSIFDSCKELLGATAGYVALLSKDDKENEVLFLDSGGLSCRVDPLLPMPVRGLRGEAYHTGKVVYCNDFQRSERVNLMPEGHAALQNVLFAPLTIDKKKVGIIGMANKPNGITERDAQMALAFGEIASVALINSRMLETLKENEKLLKAHSEQLERLVEERTKKLKDAERLVAIGETAGMVGHDIRNPLQSIIGELYLAKGEMESLPESDTKRSLEETVTMIEEQAGYINKIVTDLQDFAKPLKPCNEETTLESSLQSIISSMDIPENIELTYAFKEGFPKVKADT